MKAVANKLVQFTKLRLTFPVSVCLSLTCSLTFSLSRPFLLHGCLVNVAFCCSVNLKTKWEMASKACIILCMLIMVSFFRHFRNSSLLVLIVKGLKANRSAYWGKKPKATETLILQLSILVFFLLILLPEAVSLNINRQVCQTQKLQSE